MKKDQLSSIDPPRLFESPPIDLPSSFANPDFLESLASAFPVKFFEPIATPPPASLRQQVLERVLDRIAGQDLAGKLYVERYLRHKYRRNCKSNTLRLIATTLVQFLSFFRQRGKRQLEQLCREDIEAFVETLQDRKLKPATVCTRLRNVYAFIRFLIEHKVVGYELLEHRIKLKLPDRLPRAIVEQVGKLCPRRVGADPEDILAIDARSKRVSRFAGLLVGPVADQVAA